MPNTVLELETAGMLQGLHQLQAPWLSEKGQLPCFIDHLENKSHFVVIIGDESVEFFEQLPAMSSSFLNC